MSDFEFLAGFYGILLGLIIAEVAVKFADAIDSHAKRPIGLLTPMLAILVLFDVSSFWMWLWSERSLLMVTWTVTLVSMVLGIVYFLAAALIFPRDRRTGPASMPITGRASDGCWAACCSPQRSSWDRT